jgi:hypothetical protein
LQVGGKKPHQNEGDTRKQQDGEQQETRHIQS